MRRALLIKFGAIGDVVMLIPAAFALHRSGYAVDWVCGAAVAPLLALYPWIHPIVGDDRALLHGRGLARVRALSGIWRTIAGRSYELCATLYYDRRYRLLAAPVRARRKVMLSGTERNTRLLPGRHHTDEYARILLGLADDVRTTSLEPIRPQVMPKSPLPRSEHARVILAPAGARNLLRDDALRRWPIERYAELAAILIRHGLEIVLVGGPEDGWASGAFERLQVMDCIGRYSLTQTLGLLDESDVLVTHDTGPLHLAGPTSVGIVSIFGPTDPWGRLPQRENSVALWGGEGFACRPCYDGRDYAPCRENLCMRQISVEMVVDEVMTLIRQRAHAGGPPRIVLPGSTMRA